MMWHCILSSSFSLHWIGTGIGCRSNSSEEGKPLSCSLATRIPWIIFTVKTNFLFGREELLIQVQVNLFFFTACRTNIYINPPIAPPLVGGYGYGYGVPFYGGWGWSPFSFFAPGPSVAVGIGGGFDLLALFLFLGALAAVVRRFFGSRNEEDDY